MLLALGGLFRRLGVERSSRWVSVVERPAKRWAFGCRMCGQCILHSTGMACPMRCPKQLRNGPCGGVSLDGKCEVDPAMSCVWVEAIEGAAATSWADEIHRLNPSRDWRLDEMSSWVTYAVGRDRSPAIGFEDPPSALDVASEREG